MKIVLLVAAAALFGAAIAVLIIALRRPRKPKTPPSRQDPLTAGEMPQFGPRQLGPGAIVSYGGIDYVVRGSVTYREGPFVWWEHLIEGGTGAPIWFSVEEDEGRLELAMWVARKDLQLEPGGEHIVDGVRFGKRNTATPPTPARARPVYPPAAKWTSSTVPMRTSPPC